MERYSRTLYHGATEGLYEKDNFSDFVKTTFGKLKATLSNEDFTIWEIRSIDITLTYFNDEDSAIIYSYGFPKAHQKIEDLLREANNRFKKE